MLRPFFFEGYELGRFGLPAVPHERATKGYRSATGVTPPALAFSWSGKVEWSPWMTQRRSSGFRRLLRPQLALDGPQQHRFGATVLKQ
jgi:hypothetical protein